ncbi:MAG: hypothetical protein QM485_15590 [Flavobacteriaceae bacterium]
MRLPFKNRKINKAILIDLCILAFQACTEEAKVALKEYPPISSVFNAY